MGCGGRVQKIRPKSPIEDLSQNGRSFLPWMLRIAYISDKRQILRNPLPSLIGDLLMKEDGESFKYLWRKINI